MAYVWVNPVTDRMYGANVLNDFLRRHGHKRVEVSNDWLAVVKEKYRLVVSEVSKPVMDVRCPKIVGLLEELDVADKVVISEIQPILIHCGTELSERKDLHGEEKIITTPCQALADMGNELGLKDTWFIPWKRLLELFGDEPEGILPEESPIPPGFFDDLEFEIVSLTGEKEIRDYFNEWVPEDVQLVEMLFCKEGCHNGDGIRRCE